MPSHGRLQQKKIEDAIRNVDELVKQVRHTFEICPEITQVAVVLGATIVSPKEIYLLQFPPLSPEADNLSSNEAVKTLFRQLVSQDPLRHIKAIPITNMSVLINAPRNSSCSWFLPKDSYKLPNRGNQFHFNLLSTTDAHGSQDLSRDFSIIDLSGFEPLESSVMDSPISEVTFRSSSTNSDCSASLSAEYVCIDSENDIEILDDSDCDDVTPKNLTIASSTSDITCNTSLPQMSDISQASNLSEETRSLLAPYQRNHTRMDAVTDSDYIWFQSPTSVKGFRQKGMKQLSANDLL